MTGALRMASGRLLTDARYVWLARLYDATPVFHDLRPIDQGGSWETAWPTVCGQPSYTLGDNPPATMRERGHQLPYRLVKHVGRPCAHCWPETAPCNGRRRRRLPTGEQLTLEAAEDVADGG